MIHAPRPIEGETATRLHTLESAFDHPEVGATAPAENGFRFA